MDAVEQGLIDDIHPHFTQPPGQRDRRAYNSQRSPRSRIKCNFGLETVTLEFILIARADQSVPASRARSWRIRPDSIATAETSMTRSPNPVSRRE